MGRLRVVLKESRQVYAELIADNAGALQWLRRNAHRTKGVSLMNGHLGSGLGCPYPPAFGI
jgi:hypothetical protein